MRILVINTKTIHILFLTIGLFLSGSCKHDKRSITNNEVNIDIEESRVAKDFLIGSWKDTSKSALHFTLLDNGTARSDNMKTLHYKNWKLNGNQITLTIESIGNDTLSMDTETYIIEKLTRERLILRKGNTLSEYTKI